mmetsp:Transcript_42094/g.96667  ORF Transcript_42094/g.96667 Transcript_42094/m.96667 type:complete len:130 (+) Transcript_42094:723-1112(+)
MESDASKSLDAQPAAMQPQPFNPRSPPKEDFISETFDDPKRVSFLRKHVISMHSAMMAGADIKGFFVWSFLDNFEWAEGYTKRFGLVHVDYATQKRTVKASARLYANIIRQWGLAEIEKEDETPRAREN